MKQMWKVKSFSNRTSWKVFDVQIVRYAWVLLCLSVSVPHCPCADISLLSGVTWCIRLCVLPTGYTQCHALSQVTLCQPRLLRLRRSSPLPHFWSVASLQVLPSGCRHTDCSTHRCFSGPPFSTHNAPRVPDPSFRYFLTLCKRLRPASHLTMPPHNYRSRSSSSGVSSNDPLDRQASPSAHCNAGSACPPQPANIAALYSQRSASHASDGHEHTRARVLPPPGLEKYARQ